MMKIKITDYIHQHFSTISLLLDILAFVSFAFGAVVYFLNGNIPAGGTTVCAIAWVFIARIREDSSEFYATMYNSIKNAYDSLKDECDALKTKIKDFTKDHANDCINSKN